MIEIWHETKDNPGVDFTCGTCPEGTVIVPDWIYEKYAIYEMRDYVHANDPRDWLEELAAKYPNAICRGCRKPIDLASVVKEAKLLEANNGEGE